MIQGALHLAKTPATATRPHHAPMAKQSFTITMEDDLREAIDRLAAENDRSRNYVINLLCHAFLAKGALHPEKTESARREGEGR